jgi:hypothetical protein
LDEPSFRRLTFLTNWIFGKKNNVSDSHVY